MAFGLIPKNCTRSWTGFLGEAMPLPGSLTRDRTLRAVSKSSELIRICDSLPRNHRSPTPVGINRTLRLKPIPRTCCHRSSWVSCECLTPDSIDTTSCLPLTRVGLPSGKVHGGLLKSCKCTTTAKSKSTTKAGVRNGMKSSAVLGCSARTKLRTRSYWSAFTVGRSASMLIPGRAHSGARQCTCWALARVAKASVSLRGLAWLPKFRLLPNQGSIR